MDQENVRVTPQALGALVWMGSVAKEVTAEWLAKKMEIEVGDVISTLDRMERAGVVEDVDAERFYLTDGGCGLYDAIYSSVVAVSEDKELMGESDAE